MVELGSTRDAYAEALIEIGKNDERVVVLDSDLATSTKTAKFGKIFPERFFNIGVSEADMINTAAGLAASGKIAFCSSFAMFATGKPWEEIRNTVCYSNLNVKIVASHSGFSVGEDGASHQANEDMGIMRIIPNMRVVAPSDPVMTKEVIYAVYKTAGPFYVRLTRPKIPYLYKDRELNFQLGKGIVLRRGREGAVIATGTMVYPSLKAAEKLAEKGISLYVIDMHTIKPIDKELIVKMAKETGLIITVEEHSIIGGLGSAVTEVVSEFAPCYVKRIGVEDRFTFSGNYKDLYRYFKMDVEGLTDTFREILNGR